MIPINDNKEEKKTAPQTEAEEVKAESEQCPSTEAEPEKEPAEGKTPETADSEKEAGKGGKEPSQTALKDEIALLTDKYLRVCAEYDNFRKRTQKEKDNLYGDIRANVVTSFLPVYDNLVRALGAVTEDEAYRKGVEMIMNQFNSTLEKLGVTEIKAVGEKFDPALHNAVMHVDDETKGENEVIEEFQKGFKIGDKVIRFSMVKVAN